MEYRLGTDKPIWHFCDRCPSWPAESFNIVILENLPPDFELCETCIALTTADTGP
jgi:hypothetical protein